MKTKSFKGMKCSLAGTLELIGDRWTLLLIRDLTFGVRRYDDLQQGIGIPAATLSARLKAMEDSGIVARLRYQDRPPRYDYQLTEKGRDLWKVQLALREWGDKWDVTGTGLPTLEVVDRLSGKPLALAMVEKSSGAAVPREQVEIRPGAGADEMTERLFRFARGGDDTEA